jgi:hypothetical protein
MQASSGRKAETPQSSAVSGVSSPPQLLITCDAAESLRPFCFRLPKPGTVDPYFGGARTFWNQQVLPSEANGYRPIVKSIVMRQPGAKRGIRFILYDSAREFFLKLAQEQNVDEALCPTKMQPEEKPAASCSENVQLSECGAKNRESQGA